MPNFRKEIQERLRTEKGKKIIDLYNKGYITFSEAMNLLAESSQPKTPIIH